MTPSVGGSFHPFEALFELHHHHFDCDDRIIDQQSEGVDRYDTDEETRRSMTLPETRKPRLFWTRADTTPVNARSPTSAGCTTATSASWGTVLGSCAACEDVQAVRSIVAAQTAPARVRVLTRNIAMLPRKRIGVSSPTRSHHPPPSARNVPTAALAESARVCASSSWAVSSWRSASRTSVRAITPPW